jgi:hypothetical protein
MRRWSKHSDLTVRTNRSANASAFGVRKGGDQSLSPYVLINHHSACHPDISCQLRRGRQLSAHLWSHVGGVRRGDAHPSAGSECLAPPTRGRASQGAGVCKPSGCLDGGLASHHVGPCRSCHRGPVVCGDRSGSVEGIRQQPGVVPVSVAPILLICGLAAGVIVIANIIAVAPALAATRSKPGYLLRAAQLNAV